MTRMTAITARTRVAAALAVLATSACARPDAAPRAGGVDSARAGGAGGARQLVVFNAGSLARPLRAVLDSFAAREGVTVAQENAGSLETARKLTELGNVPDIIALADDEVFPQLLMPAHVSWYVRFARNRMVLAHTSRSRFAAEITPDNWHEVIRRPGVEVGRSNPSLDPNGYRTLLVMQLAERHYGRPGLAAQLLAAAPERNIRPKEVDLVALLQAGELDYAWSYQSLAASAGLGWVRLPHEIDLGTPADSALYARASVRVTGKTPRDSVTFTGMPIVYGFSIPRRAPHPELAQRFAAFLMSDGKAILRRAQLPALERPLLVGAGVPASLLELTIHRDSALGTRLGPARGRMAPP
ncbi:MAG: substrate-binding domain-containing protein [Gemmatimonadaceae bacterium]